MDINNSNNNSNYDLIKLKKLYTFASFCIIEEEIIFNKR